VTLSCNFSEWGLKNKPCPKGHGLFDVLMISINSISLFPFQIAACAAAQAARKQEY
jgi:hypothetical protein